MDTDALRTTMYEIMYIINSKPLTADSLENPEEVIIAPNHLLTMKSSYSLPPDGVYEDQAVYGRNMFKKTQQIAEEFWRNWQDYLVKIENRQKWRTVQQNLKVGDLVSIIDDNTPRCQWKLGIIEEVKPGADGLVRNVSVRLANADCDNSGKRRSPSQVLERPIQKLVLIMSS